MLYDWGLIGHQKQLNGLESDILSNNIAQAYLFVGPKEVGKMICARQMATILQCPNHYCKKCPTCLLINQDQHYDTIVFKDEGESIKIEQIRELVHSLSLTIQSRYKIIIIQNIERMTLDASNCLLKTLEEPNPRTIFLLTSSRIKEVLGTVLSRVRLIRFYAISEFSLKKELEQLYQTDNQRLQMAVFFSMGLPRNAIALIENEEYFRRYYSMYEALLDILNNASINRRFSLIEAIYKNEEEVTIFLDLLLILARKRLLEEANAFKINHDQRNYLFLIEKIDETRYLLKKNVNVRLALENLMLNL